MLLSRGWEVVGFHVAASTGEEDRGAHATLPGVARTGVSCVHGIEGIFIGSGIFSERIVEDSRPELGRDERE